MIGTVRGTGEEAAYCKKNVLMSDKSWEPGMSECFNVIENLKTWKLENLKTWELENFSSASNSQLKIASFITLLIVIAM